MAVTLEHTTIPQLVVEVYKALEAATTPYAAMIAAKGLKLILTLIRKNRGYGNSVFEPPVLAPSVKPEAGIRVRMSDKITRIRALTNEIERAVKAGEAYDQLFESLQDSFLDLAGYSVLWAVNDDLETEATSLVTVSSDCQGHTSIHEPSLNGALGHTCPNCRMHATPSEPHTPDKHMKGVCEILEE